MAYLLIEDFKGGVDRRRPIYAGKPGTLWECINAHISFGGDVEKAKAFVRLGSFSSNTYALAARRGVLWTFGSDDPSAVSTPGGVQYQRLTHPEATTPMTEVLDIDLFNGEFYVIARFSDGAVLHFYAGTLVADWNDGIVRAYMGTLDAFCTILAALIDGAGNYIATSAGTVITVTASQNNMPFTIATLVTDMGGTDDQSITENTTQVAAPGVPQITTFTLAGTFEPGDGYGIALTTATVTEYFGNIAKPIGMATCIKTHKRKLYAGADRILWYSAVNAATAWNTDLDPGAGFLNASNHLGGSESIAGLETYQGRLAVMSTDAVQLWLMQDDDAQNDPQQFVENTGTSSPRSSLEYGGNDMFYLDTNGIRSMRARDASNNALLSGVGAAINTLVREWMATGASPTEITNAVSAIEPDEGRYWLAIGSRIFVYSFFPETGIAAWTWYEPGFDVSWCARVSRRIFVRDTDGNLYVYGGYSGSQYDSSTVTVAMPYQTAGKDGTFKTLIGIDMVATGTWSAKIRTNPNDTSAFVDCGDNDGVTTPGENWGAVGRATHMAPLLTNSEDGYASLSKFILYFKESGGRA